MSLVCQYRHSIITWSGHHLPLKSPCTAPFRCRCNLESENVAPVAAVITISIATLHLRSKPFFQISNLNFFFAKVSIEIHNTFSEFASFGIFFIIDF